MAPIKRPKKNWDALPLLNRGRDIETYERTSDYHEGCDRGLNDRFKSTCWTDYPTDRHSREVIPVPGGNDLSRQGKWNFANHQVPQEEMVAKVIEIWWNQQRAIPAMSVPTKVSRLTFRQSVREMGPQRSWGWVGQILYMHTLDFDCWNTNQISSDGCQHRRCSPWDTTCHLVR